jgi:arylsulfatase
MAVYAAQIDRMDQGIGRILAALEASGELDNTLIMFLADNGGCAEELHDSWLAPLKRIRVVPETARDGRPVAYGNECAVLPGGEHTYQSYGVPWANLSNTPFRLYKHWVHEGGIATPFIVHWPEGFEAKGGLRHEPAYLPDVMATCIEAAGVSYPATRETVAVLPPEGTSLLPCFRGAALDRDVLCWEHEGNRALRRENWKLVCRYPERWELYDTEADRSEMRDLSSRYPDVVADLEKRHNDWSARCGVEAWERVLARRS